MLAMLKRTFKKHQTSYFPKLFIDNNGANILKNIKLKQILTHCWLQQKGITCKKIPLQKFIEFGMALKQNMTHFKQKTEIFLATRLPNS